MSYLHQSKMKCTLFYKQHFYKQRQAKNRAKAKQHPEAEPLLFRNYSLSLSTLSSKNNNRDIKKNVRKISVSVLIRLYD